MSQPHPILFCPSCEKPFTNATSRTRHIKYCGSRTRHRPRSCRSCNVAKTKCNFEAPCARCAKKGIECVYESLTTVHSRRTQPNDHVGDADLNSLLQADDGTFFEGLMSAPVDLTPYNFQSQDAISNDFDFAMPLSQTAIFEDTSSFGGPFNIKDTASMQLSVKADNGLTLCGKKDTENPSWCSWTRHGVSLAVVMESSKIWPNALVPTQLDRPQAQHNADIVIQSLRSLPTMMMRKATLPWYIHSRFPQMPDSSVQNLPQPLTACMSIAQMFVSRDQDTRAFLWRTVKAEHLALAKVKDQMSKHELLVAMQACMTYLVMFIIDYSPEYESDSRELLHSLHEITLVFKMISTYNVSNEFYNASTSWEEWIFAESRRRIMLTWFLIGCVVCTKTGKPCDPTGSYRALPLPGPKSLWESSTAEAWKAEYEAYYLWQLPALSTLGDLIDLQRSSYSPSNARKLDGWNAGVDNLGSLLNLVGGMF